MISVIVCTYNRCESLRDTLQALKAQQVGEELRLELIVVDNNSTDQTKAVVEAVAREAPWPMRYVFEGKQGLSHARNRGIQEAEGDIIAFTDDDVVPHPDWVTMLWEMFKERRADCVGGRILPLWKPGLQREALSEFLAQYQVALDHGPDILIAERMERPFLIGANMAFRREVFQEVGVFRTDLGRKGRVLMCAEDTELIRRLFRAGKLIVYTPHAVVHHKVEPERLRPDFLRRYRFQGGRSIALMTEGTQLKLERWLIKECAGNGLAAVWAYARARRLEGLEAELLFWAQLGHLVGTVQAQWNKCPPSA